MSTKIPIEEHEQERMRQYLLGGLPAAERNAIQDRMFRDAEFFSRMRLAEIDLIDALAAGWLPAGSIEPARRFLAESSQPEAFAASAGLAEALADQDSPGGLLERLRKRI